MKALLLLILVPLSTFSQDLEPGKNKRMSIGFILSPDYSYRYLQATSSAFDPIKNMRNEFEVPKFGFTSGLSFLYKINNRFILETGLLYTDKGEKIKNPNYLVVDESDPIYQSLQSVKTINSYRYLEIPLKVNYNIFTNRIKVFASAGLSTNFFLSSFTIHRQELPNGNMNKTKSKNIDPPFSALGFAALAGLGMDYEISEKFQFRLEPIYRRSFTSLVKNVPIKAYYYSIGVNAAVYYRF